MNSTLEHNETLKATAQHSQSGKVLGNCLGELFEEPKDTSGHLLRQYLKSAQDLLCSILKSDKQCLKYVSPISLPLVNVKIYFRVP